MRPYLCNLSGYDNFYHLSAWFFGIVLSNYCWYNKINYTPKSTLKSRVAWRGCTLSFLGKMTLPFWPDLDRDPCYADHILTLTLTQHSSLIYFYICSFFMTRDVQHKFSKSIMLNVQFWWFDLDFTWPVTLKKRLVFIIIVLWQGFLCHITHITATDGSQIAGWGVERPLHAGSGKWRNSPATGGGPWLSWREEGKRTTRYIWNRKIWYELESFGEYLPHTFSGVSTLAETTNKKLGIWTPYGIV